MLVASWELTFEKKKKLCIVRTLLETFRASCFPNGSPFKSCHL